jgi:hypothetical protein
MKGFIWPSRVGETELWPASGTSAYGRFLPVLKAVHPYDGLLQRFELLLSQKALPHFWGAVHNLS